MSGMKFFSGWLLGINKAFSSTTQLERDTLYRYAAGKKAIVEIGVYHGLNTRKFLDLLAPDGKLYAVDPFFKGRLGFSSTKVIARREVGSDQSRVVWLEELGSEAAGSFAKLSTKPVDFIFFDGDHSWEGIDSDWQAWREHLGSGCIVAFHDSIDSPNQSADATTGSVRYTQDVIAKDPDLELIEEADSLSVFRRR